jgi:hypothetical protein
LHVPLQADGAGALAVDAQLSALVASSLVALGLRVGTLGRLAVAVRLVRALALRATLLVVVDAHKGASTAITAWTWKSTD